MAVQALESLALLTGYHHRGETSQQIHQFACKSRKGQYAPKASRNEHFARQACGARRAKSHLLLTLLQTPGGASIKDLAKAARLAGTLGARFSVGPYQKEACPQDNLREKKTTVSVGITSPPNSRIQAPWRQLARPASADLAAEIARLDRVYLGEINHHGQSYKGDHASIVNLKVFEAVQEKLSKNRKSQREDRSSTGALLTGRIFDDRGNRMSPTYAIKKNGVRYRYYVSTALVQGQKKSAGAVGRIAAPDIEQLVLDTLKKQSIPANDGTALSDRDLIDALFERVDVKVGSIVIRLRTKSTEGDASSNIVSLAWTPNSSRPKRELIVSSHDGPGSAGSLKAEHRNRLLTGIAKARRWLKELVDQPAIDTGTIAVREGKSERAVRQTLSLAFLAPDIIKAAARRAPAARPRAHPADRAAYGIGPNNIGYSGFCLSFPPPVSGTSRTGLRALLLPLPLEAEY